MLPSILPIIITFYQAFLLIKPLLSPNLVESSLKHKPHLVQSPPMTPHFRRKAKGPTWFITCSCTSHTGPSLCLEYSSSEILLASSLNFFMLWRKYHPTREVFRAHLYKTATIPDYNFASLPFTFTLFFCIALITFKHMIYCVFLPQSKHHEREHKPYILLLPWGLEQCLLYIAHT